MSHGQVRILDGNTFVVSDERGDIEASPTDPTGLFSFDTRFLSRWVLTVNGQRLNPLSIDDVNYFESRFFLVPGTRKKRLWKYCRSSTESGDSRSLSTVSTQRDRKRVSKENSPLGSVIDASMSPHSSLTTNVFPLRILTCAPST